MGSLPLPCFDSGGVTRVSGRGEKEIGAVELETDKFDFEEGNNNDKENILMNKPTKNDWVCIANNECQATNRRGGLYCRMCGTAYKESYVKLKQIQEKEREEKKKRKKEEKEAQARSSSMLKRDFNSAKKEEDDENDDDDDDDGDVESSLMFLTMSNASITSKRSGGYADGRADGADESTHKKGVETRKRLAEALTWEEMREEQLKKSFPMMSFVFFITFVYVLVPICVCFFGVIFAGGISYFEDWSLEHAFFFVLGEILKAPMNLNKNMDYPSHSGGVCLSVMLSIWAYMIILTTVALLSDLEIITFWALKMEAILVDVFRVTVLSDSDARARAIGSRCVIFSFKVGELLGLVCFMIILAPFMITLVGMIGTLLLYETEGIPYRKALTLSLRGLSLGKSYDETISPLESSASLVYIMYLCCTEMALGTVFVGFLFQSHFKKSWLPAKWAKARRRRIGNDGEAAETMAVSKRKGNE
jgi:uncharacterized Zn finger protein (UPF0148 family)|tara:strand:- start:3830 stop:5257 length:1428 start_codon:yes stop_codon:yes gene_type:complete